MFSASALYDANWRLSQALGRLLAAAETTNATLLTLRPLVPRFVLSHLRACCRGCFERLWVKQEVWAAKAVTVMCECDCMLWESLQQAVDWIHYLDTETDSGPAQAEGYQNLLEGFRRKSEDGAYRKDDLLDVLCQTSLSECSDVRDHVYGVLGMSNHADDEAADRELLTTDYSRSAPEVFQDAARYIASKQNNLSFLSLFASFGGLIRGEELPSWCPNWALP